MTPTSGDVGAGLSLGLTLMSGDAEGAALVLEQPLSFWGGLDPATGVVIDHHHPQLGQDVRGKILVMPSGRGSSSSSSVLAECVRAGTAPAGIVLAEQDGILALGGVVAELLYGRSCPIVVLGQPHYARIRTGMKLAIRATAGEATLFVSDGPARRRGSP